MESSTSSDSSSMVAGPRSMRSKESVGRWLPKLLAVTICRNIGRRQAQRERELPGNRAVGPDAHVPHAGVQSVGSPITTTALYPPMPMDDLTIGPGTRAVCPSTSRGCPGAT